MATKAPVFKNLEEAKAYFFAEAMAKAEKAVPKEPDINIIEGDYKSTRVCLNDTLIAWVQGYRAKGSEKLGLYLNLGGKGKQTTWHKIGDRKEEVQEFVKLLTQFCDLVKTSELV
jgi:hypothetical protein